VGLTAARSLARGRHAGAELPDVAELAALRHGFFKFGMRQSTVTLCAGTPGAGKSLFALWLATKYRVPALYFSADSNAFIVSTRLAAALSGASIEEVAAALKEGGEGYYQDILDDLPVRFCYDPNPSRQTIDEELDAWVEMYDTYPRLVVVDNLMDVVGGGDSEFAAYKDVLLGLKTLSRETEACVLVLHHMSETGTDPHLPAPRKSVMGKVSQTPDNVLSVALSDDGRQFLVSVVKHRDGPADPTGAKFERFTVDLGRVAINHWTPPPIITTFTPHAWKGARDDDD
jgi:hypothetical protein